MTLPEIPEILPSNKAITRAGEALACESSSDKELSDAMATLTQWRTVHHYPINTIQASLRNKCKSLKIQALIAQRIKRTPSIVAKLKRNKGMNLARMQDIGGLRAIVPEVGHIEKIHAYYQNAAISFKVQSMKDYIQQPKNDGYRCLHLVFKYENKRYPQLQGMQVELQVRTELQHIWATAVETLGIITRTALKAGEGEDAPRRFLLLCSGIFALQEQCPLPPPLEGMSKEAMMAELQALEREFHILKSITGVNLVNSHIHGDASKEKGFLLLTLNSGEKRVHIEYYTEKDRDYAMKRYAVLESQNKNDSANDTVLISASSLKNIRKAYPNYFLDTARFVQEIEGYLKAK